MHHALANLGAFVLMLGSIAHALPTIAIVVGTIFYLCEIWGSDARKQLWGWWLARKGRK